MLLPADSPQKHVDTQGLGLLDCRLGGPWRSPRLPKSGGVWRRQRAQGSRCESERKENSTVQRQPESSRGRGDSVAGEIPCGEIPCGEQARREGQEGLFKVSPAKGLVHHGLFRTSQSCSPRPWPWTITHFLWPWVFPRGNLPWPEATEASAVFAAAGPAPESQAQAAARL